jgi:hypothetical protein
MIRAGSPEGHVGFDESSKQLVKEIRVPIPAAPGRPAATDYEYERNGTANPFMMFEPLGGKRHVIVTERRTAVDYAHAIQDLIDVRYPHVQKIVLVQDNLLRSVHAGGGPTPDREAGDPPHPQARQLAEHGGDRTGNSRSPMLGSADSQLLQADQGSGCVGTSPK